jgi:hypothetical protein
LLRLRTGWHVFGSRQHPALLLMPPLALLGKLVFGSLTLVRPC